MFPRPDGTPWRDHDYRNWRKRTFKRAVAKLGEGWEDFRPYDLRHSFASLLLADGRSLPSVARAMGHSVAVLSSTYAQVIEELEGGERASAEDQIQAARVKNVSRSEAA